MKQLTHSKQTRAALKKYAFVFGSAATLISRAHGQATTVANFTFETSGLAISTSTPSTTTSPMLLAEVGSGTAVGVHTSTSTVYSSPAGNGSLHSFSANHFAPGDYYQFSIDATQYNNVAIAFDAVSSTTGPHAFTLQYSTDGGTNSTDFATFSSYTLIVQTSTNSTGGTTTAGFATGASNSAFNFAFNFSGVTSLNNSIDIFRLVNTDTSTSVAATGTNRVDNFIETGVLSVPEPSSMALFSVAGASALLALGRRRRRA